ncbi:MAG: threonine synthase [Thermodesulfobacteriota bacterium]
MNNDLVPKDIHKDLVPLPAGKMMYRCLGCAGEFGIEQLLYTCPDCGQVLMLVDAQFDRLKAVPAERWQRIFDYRKLTRNPALKGIYRYHEFIGPVLPLSSIIYLGEGHTPMIEANGRLQEMAGMRFFYKNDGQNPSASFKDRGMASAMSYINYLIQDGKARDVLAICASTGDTSAAAALYAAYMQPAVKSAVLLPHKKVTPQQLSQPLGSGATVFEIPGVFDDCMKVVEALSEQYNVALLNSKNAWRILGQESYSYEIAQEFNYDVSAVVVVVPIGNAGNITAVINGFLKWHAAGIIRELPKIVGVQSEHADPVFRYYREPDAAKRQFVPVTVQPSVAQAAMIGNPVSMPRVIHLVDQYNAAAGRQKIHFVQVSEQAIMDWELQANRNGHIACTHGGETLAGLVAAKAGGCIEDHEVAVIDSTAHALKFSGFQQLYFDNQFPEAYRISPNPDLINAPLYIRPDDLKQIPEAGQPLDPESFGLFVRRVSEEIASVLKLRAK